MGPNHEHVSSEYYVRPSRDDAILLCDDRLCSPLKSLGERARERTISAVDEVVSLESRKEHEQDGGLMDDVGGWETDKCNLCTFKKISPLPNYLTGSLVA